MKLSTKDKWLWCYFPTAALWSLPVVAGYVLFGEALNPDKVLFSNDGPLGVANSHWMQDGYYPGGAMWVDSSWLGFSAGRNPIAITQLVYWLCLHPIVMIPLLLVGSLACGYVIIKDILNSPKELLEPTKPYEPAPYIPKNQSNICWFFRYLLMIVLFRFAWIVVEKNPFIHPIESLCWLAYGFLGLPWWISAELETKEYVSNQKNIVR